MQILEKETSLESQLLSFIGNRVDVDSEHGGMISYSSTFSDSTVLMPIDQLKQRMKVFSTQIQKAVNGNAVD